MRVCNYWTDEMQNGVAVRFYCDKPYGHGGEHRLLTPTNSAPETKQSETPLRAKLCLWFDRYWDQERDEAFKVLIAEVAALERSNAELVEALREGIESIEELNVLIAEIVTRTNFQDECVLDVDLQKPTSVKYRTVILVYEDRIKKLRVTLAEATKK